MQAKRCTCGNLITELDDKGNLKSKCDKCLNRELKAKQQIKETQQPTTYKPRDQLQHAYIFGKFFYDMPIWKHTAEQIRLRDAFYCVCCHASVAYKQACCVHHIMPLEMITFDQSITEHEKLLQATDPKNLITVCKSCHMKIHAYIDAHGSCDWATIKFLFKISNEVTL